MGGGVGDALKVAAPFAIGMAAPYAIPALMGAGAGTAAAAGGLAGGTGLGLGAMGSVGAMPAGLFAGPGAALSMGSAAPAAAGMFAGTAAPLAVTANAAGGMGLSGMLGNMMNPESLGMRGMGMLMNQGQQDQQMPPPMPPAGPDISARQMVAPAAAQLAGGSYPNYSTTFGRPRPF